VEVEERPGAPADDSIAVFEAIFHAHYAEVLAYSLRRLREQSTAEDAVAETFAVAWRRRHDIPEPALPWLYGVARRVTSNQRRSHERRGRLRERILSQPDEPSGGRDPAELAEGRDEVLAAFSRLPEASREVLRLVAWEELDSKSAAAALGCSAAAFRVRLHRARRLLSAELEAETSTGHMRPSADDTRAEEAR